MNDMGIEYTREEGRLGIGNRKGKRKIEKRG